ncbi:hypothetical protein SAMN02745181_2705 [Rubritalea squalenifaciens DSM 18772]|uniref:Uncharacterized protein n=1 Tax=Rubritalea squalenifaciens DSM 18772 TaxID=1123071 RepID=A0A1M6MEF6_9BACT|nr:hypothetical protein [Rubritalea squalenifaciens]SHJ81817.1 hypothetical protein SAMN02745181_2705 [Rubritalea squalenifaciens DSM 18772]
MLRKLTAASIALTCAVSASDTVKFKNGDVISGTIIDITDTGAVRFQYPEATETLEINAEGLDSLTFEQEGTSTHNHGERIYLSNGDELPCDLKKMDDKSIAFSTWYAGDFSIPRSKVTKISFENKPESLVYSGPNSLKEWTTAENWVLEQGVLNVNGKGLLAKEFELPNNFIIRFNLEWDGSSPRFRLHLCGRENTTVDRIDRYYLDFTSSGFQFNRVTPRNFDKLGRVSIRSREIKNSTVNVELKVDRQNQQTVLYLDGVEHGTFDDNAASAPLGSFVILESNQRDGDTLKIKNLQILEWGGNAITRQKNEEIPNKKADTLFDREGFRFSGESPKIEKINDQLTIFFDYQFAKKPMQVPSSRASILYLKEQEPSEEKLKSSYTATLAGGGKISLGQTSLNKDVATTRHPILGECNIKRTAFSTLNSAASQNK